MGMGLKSDDLVFNKIVSYLHLFFCILLVFHADLQRFMYQSVYSFNIHNSKPPPPPPLLFHAPRKFEAAGKHEF